MNKPVIAVVGRPNVGKSTLFNKLIGQRLSIVDDTPGVTRDRIYGEVEWCGKTAFIVDTGGIEPKSDDIILVQMRRQAQLAIDTANVIILVTDCKSGMVATDMDVAQMLQKSGKPVVLCVNKCDTLGEPSPEFYEFYKVFLSLFYEHREYFYDWCDIGSIYGAPSDCIWGGGRVSDGDSNPEEVLTLLEEYGISSRLTFSNSLLKKEHLSDRKCNELCRLFEKNNKVQNGVIVHSELLLDYLKNNYPELYLVSSTTKVITDFDEFLMETDRDDFKYVVPDFRLNKTFDRLGSMTCRQKDKVEFLCNECCWFGCNDRKKCYEAVSRKNLGENISEHICSAPGSNEGYRFSKAMKNPGFIGVNDIKDKYISMGFSNFKIEGRGLGSALILEFLLYYMTKPEYHVHVREKVYLDNMLDLF